MSASVYTSTDRAIPRYVLALVVAFDVAMVNRFHFFEPAPDPAVPWSPEFLVRIHEQPVALIALSAVALIATFAFATRRRPILAGVITLIAMALLTESYAAFIGGHRRMFFSAGAALTGWTFGLVAAHLLGGDRDRADRLGEAGAAAALAATYVGSGLQKLMHEAFFSTTTLRVHLLSHHHVDDTSLSGTLAYQVATEPMLAGLLSMSVLAIQFGSALYIVSPRLRMLWGSLLISFHLGTLVFLELIYLEATILLIALSYPWDRLRRKAARTGEAAADDPPVPAPVATKMGIAAACFVLLGAVIPTAGEVIGPSPGEHHSGNREAERATDQARATEAASIDSVGPIAVGDDLGGWIVTGLAVTDDHVEVQLAGGSRRVGLQFSAPTVETSPGAFDSGGLRILYRPTDLPFAEFEPAGRALAARLVEGVDGAPAETVSEWIAAARAAGSR